MSFNFFEMLANPVPGSSHDCAGCADPTKPEHNKIPPEKLRTRVFYATPLAGQDQDYYLNVIASYRALHTQFLGINILTASVAQTEPKCMVLEMTTGQPILSQLFKPFITTYPFIFLCEKTGRSAYWHTGCLSMKLALEEAKVSTVTAAPRRASMLSVMAAPFRKRSASEASAAAPNRVVAPEDMLIFLFNPAPPAPAAVENTYEPLSPRSSPTPAARTRSPALSPAATPRCATAAPMGMGMPPNLYGNIASALPATNIETLDELLAFIKPQPGTQIWSNQRSWSTIFDKVPPAILEKLRQFTTRPPPVPFDVSTIDDKTLNLSIGDGMGILSINNPSRAGDINKTIFPRDLDGYYHRYYCRVYYSDIVIAVSKKDGNLSCVPTEEFFTHMAKNSTVLLPPSTEFNQDTVSLPYTQTRVSYQDHAPSLYSNVVRIFQMLPRDMRTPSPELIFRPGTPPRRPPTPILDTSDDEAATAEPSRLRRQRPVVPPRARRTDVRSQNLPFGEEDTHL